MFKLLRRLILLCLILVALAVVGLLFADRLLVKAVETGGGYALGVETDVDDASLGLLSGKVELSGLSVASPAGFGEKPILSVGKVATQISPGKLMGDEAAELDSLTIQGINLRVAQRDGKWNYEPILASLKRFQTDDPKAGGKRFIIRRVELSDIAVTLDLHPVTALLADSLKTLHVGEITLSDVGAGEAGGEGTAELVGILFQALMGAAAPVLPGDAQEALGGQLAEVIMSRKWSFGAPGASGEGGLLRGVQNVLGGDKKEDR